MALAEAGLEALLAPTREELNITDLLPQSKRRRRTGGGGCDNSVATIYRSSLKRTQRTFEFVRASW